METLAATATVLQVSVYAYNVAQALQELCQTIRNGHTKLQEKCKRLEVLEIVVRQIEQDTRLHRQPVIEYLVIIREHILRLHGSLLHKLGSQRDTFLRRLSAGLSLLRAEKKIKDAFASLAEDCDCLTLYMSQYNSGSSTTHSMAPVQQQRRAPLFNEQGEVVPETTQEVSVPRPSGGGDIILSPFCRRVLFRISRQHHALVQSSHRMVAVHKTRRQAMRLPQQQIVTTTSTKLSRTFRPLEEEPAASLLPTNWETSRLQRSRAVSSSKCSVLSRLKEAARTEWGTSVEEYVLPASFNGRPEEMLFIFFISRISFLIVWSEQERCLHL
jgi:hypothetical protein